MTKTNYCKFPAQNSSGGHFVNNVLRSCEHFWNLRKTRIFWYPCWTIWTLFHDNLTFWRPKSPFPERTIKNIEKCTYIYNFYLRIFIRFKFYLKESSLSKSTSPSAHLHASLNKSYYISDTNRSIEFLKRDSLMWLLTSGFSSNNTPGSTDSWTKAVENIIDSYSRRYSTTKIVNFNFILLPWGRQDYLWLFFAILLL
jgi:hypothetical protein